MKKLIVLTLTALFLAAASLAVFAETPSAEQKYGKDQEMAAPSEQVKTVENMALAQQLAKYGQENGSPAALAVAAEILLDNQAEKLEAEGTQAPISDDPVEEQPKTDSALPSMDPAQLLEQARALAEAPDMGKDGEVALSMIDRLQGRLGEKGRGRVGGVYIGTGNIGARKYSTYRATFRGRRAAVVAVVGDGDTDLDLYIYDKWGNQVVSDRRYGDQCRVQWTPSYTQEYRIVVVNLGYVYNRFNLGTN